MSTKVQLRQALAGRSGERRVAKDRDERCYVFLIWSTEYTGVLLMLLSPPAILLMAEIDDRPQFHH